MVRTVFLGFDAMDSRLTRRWAGDGTLPNFARLFDSWASLPTQNPEGLLVGGLWPAFWSGTGPAHHGSYCWRQLVPGTYTTAQVWPTDFDAEPFWLQLDRAGSRCAIFDVPLIRPVPLRHGVHVVDWGTHDGQLDCTVTDPRFAQQLEALGPYPQKRCDITVEEHGRERLVDDLYRGFELRTAALTEMLAGPYDVVMTVFAETHCTGHHLFHLHDTAHPLHDAAMRERIGGDPLLLLYQAADRALGTVLEALPDDAAVMVLLSHGIGHHYDGNPILDEFLRRLSGHHRPSSALVRRRERLLQPLRGARRRIARTLLPQRHHWQNIRNFDGSVAWFEVPANDLYGAVRFNLVGREPHGRIRPGRDLDEAMRLVTDELLALRHERTGTPAVKRVLKTDDYHRGPRRNYLPDLLVEWNWEEPFTAVTSPSIGTLYSRAEPLRTGDHRLHGEVLVRNLTLPSEAPIRVEALGDVLVRGELGRG